MYSGICNPVTTSQHLLQKVWSVLFHAKSSHIALGYMSKMGHGVYSYTSKTRCGVASSYPSNYLDKKNYATHEFHLVHAFRSCQHEDLCSSGW